MSDESPVIQIIQQRTDADCGIAVLAMYLGESYEDVLALASRVELGSHRLGMWIKHIEATAKLIGKPLRRRRKWDFETSEGILSLTHLTFEDDHVVVLKAGLIFDTDGTVWEPETYFATKQYKPTLLLEKK